ncbi:MAG: FtsX-like permease family protein [Verrucomicrobia bacterium]|nr:FtsX-like permease family protein [Verrucomicrobiota bacterium]
MFPLLAALFSRFTWSLAWRDSRRSRGRLVLFGSALTLGVAALVAIGSLARNLDQTIDQQARSLLGADLVIESRRTWAPEMLALLDRLPAVEKSREAILASMATFPKSDNLRLTQVRAIGGRFPLYGQLETNPPEAAAAFAAGRGALIEEALLLQYGVQAGDPIKIGEREITVLGSLRKAPGEAAAFTALAPRVFIPLTELDPALEGRGSLVRYKAYFRLPETFNTAGWVTATKPQLEAQKLDATDLVRSKRQLGRAFDQVADFLHLVGFVALLLGGIGVASGVGAYLKTKVRTAALLHCLGASSRQTLAIYLVQALALGLLGSLAGAALGVWIQSLAPRFIASSSALQLSFAFQPGAVAQGIGAGLLVCLLFALVPLLPMRRVPPLLTLRSGDDLPTGRDPALWIVRALVLAGVVLLPWWQSGNVKLALGFGVALLVGMAVLGGLARLLIWAARRGTPAGLPYAWRQGFANLHRPGNRTALLLATLGLATALLLSLHLTEALLRRQFEREDLGPQPSLIFFDIRADQIEGVRGVLKENGVPDLGSVPVVTMRLASVKGRPVAEIAADPKRATPGWVLHREYRSTFREQVTDTEKILAGEFVPRVKAETTPVPISLESDIARDLGVGVGDELTFDIQGIPMPVKVASLRRVEWRRFSPNFFVVFPAGVLEEAPTFYIAVSRAEDSQTSARVQSAIVKKYPNISAVDLALVAGALREIIGKATTAVRFLSLFTIGTGLIVLVSVLLTGRYERVREAVLLRTLGASRAIVFRVLAAEYAALGSLAALTGIVLAAGGSWLLATRVFELSQPALAAVILPPSLIALGSVMLLTLAVGFLTSRGVSRQAPLAVLRAEG